MRDLTSWLKPLGFLRFACAALLALRLDIAARPIGPAPKIATVDPGWTLPLSLRFDQLAFAPLLRQDLT